MNMLIKNIVCLFFRVMKPFYKDIKIIKTLFYIQDQAILNKAGLHIDISFIYLICGSCTLYMHIHMYLIYLKLILVEVFIYH